MCIAEKQRQKYDNSHLIIAQLHDWGRWRRSQCYGLGYTSPMYKSDHAEIYDEETSERVNRVYIELKTHVLQWAKIIYLYYVDRKSMQEISVLEKMDRKAIKAIRLGAEGWMDRAINY